MREQVALPAALQVDCAGDDAGDAGDGVVAAVRHFVDQQAAGLRRVRRHGDLEGGDVGGVAVVVLRRQREVLDDLVVRIRGVQAAEGAAGDQRIGPGIADGGTAERGCGGVDDDLGNSGLAGGGDRKRRCCAGRHEGGAPGVFVGHFGVSRCC
jgi:hypothetical protein